MARVKLLLRVACVGVFLLTAQLFLFAYIHLPVTRHLARQQELADTSRFLVDTPACKIPDFNPFDPSIKKYVVLSDKISCNRDPPVTYMDGSFMRINRTYLSTKPDIVFSHCRYQSVIRNVSDHNRFSYSKFSANITTDVEVTDEFIRARCYNVSGSIISTAFHQSIVLKKKVEKRCDKNSKKHVELHRPKEMLSVQIIGVDSVSRLNFMRQMPLTREFLLKDLQAVEMLGYNKVADNTFVNVVPLLAGKFLKELPWNKIVAQKPLDKHPLIWKNFSSAGYRTMFAEDAPEIAAFDYVRKGFREAPTDYYNRPFALAMEEERGVWTHRHHCVNNILETTLHLNYVTNFSRQFRGKPHFGLTLITRLTHDNVNSAGAADDPYLNFLKTLKAEGLLNNTVLVLFSDHGIRFGDIRTTHIGRAEERLPFIFFVFPDWFGKRYPEQMRNLRLNSNRLTTPFDIYETLKDILYFDGKVRLANVTQRGISLFREVPEARSCAHAGILPHWCTCMDRKVVSPSTDSVQKVARLLVDKINALLGNYSHICRRLSLKYVHMAEESAANEDVLRFQQSRKDVIHRKVTFGERVSARVVYRLTLETVPGKALFEATVMYQNGSSDVTLQGDISRINKYGNQSECIDQHRLKKLCFCAK